MGTVTISGNDFDIYGEAADADIYFLARVGAGVWDTASVEDRAKAQVSATRWLDRQNWVGQRTVLAQALEFPRTGLVDKDGNDVGSVSVPVLVEEASYELALLVLTDASVQANATTGSNTRRVKAGSAEVEFFRPTDGTKLPTIAFEMIGLWLGGTGGLGATASGCDETSTFADANPLGFIAGLP